MTITLVHKNMGGKISSKSDERHSKVVGWVESEVVKRQDPTVIDGFDPRKSSVKRRQLMTHTIKYKPAQLFQRS